MACDAGRHIETRQSADSVQGTDAQSSLESLLVSGGCQPCVGRVPWLN